MAEHRMVLGIFVDEAAADAAVKSLMAWESDNDIVPRPVGVLVADEKGRVKEYRLGQRSGAAGAGIGLVLAVIAPPTLLAGMVGGGILATSTTGAWGWGTRIARASPRSSPVARPRSASSPADPGSAPVARETPPPVA